MPLPAFQANILYSGVSLAGGRCGDACILAVSTAALCTRHIRLAIKGTSLAWRIIVNVTVLRQDNRVLLHMCLRTGSPLERCRIIETSISNYAGGLTFMSAPVMTMRLMTFYWSRPFGKVGVAGENGDANPALIPRTEAPYLCY